ncbi:ABC transporter ATP-binding protein [Malacoplasma penetrans]|uniref:ABC transporter ATP-binding protein n=1 Tax=Malacoplasma penetrans (strain HF-2) TaxID=272633 RepID=Q8EV14_MALP2|nr:ATP-binding cassette domain-containing protein [Malacoplasma penetrans]RXY96713.1 ABC transporter ATP-binding protein [Malacoplasma penetrans]BAC44547.1 ABC transporter ATP-binding protein [Malacoplasma penetrans HF-2]
MKQHIGYISVFKRLILMLSKNKKAFYGAIFLSLLKTTFSVATSIGLGIVIQNFFYDLNSNSPASAFINFSIGCALIMIGYTLYFFAYIISQKLILKLTYHIGYSIRELFFNKIRRMPFKIVEKAARGDLISRGTTDTNALAINLSVCIGEIFTAPLVVIGVFIGLLIISPILTAITLGFYLVLVTVSFIISLKAGPKYMRMQNEVGKLNGVVEEYVSGRKAIKSFCYEEKAFNLFKEINHNQAKESRGAEMILNFIWPWNDFIETVMYAFIYVLGIIFFVNNINSGSIFFPSYEIGLLTSFVLLARIATGETSNSLRLAGTLQKTTVASKRVFAVLDEINEVDQGKLEPTVQGKIEFKNVNFSYVEDRPILKNVSFTINPNETVAIVGPTGSGKTTMASLISRFYEIDSGEILIDGTNIKDISKQSLFKNISIVLQDPFLFSESIEKNIWYGNTNATAEQVIDVCKKSNVDYFIKKLPDGYETIMSEKMSDLSLGQIQLISIARAFMSEAKILVLDEATSSVDTKTEIDIQNALMKITNNKTVIVIAHRLSTVVKADKIIVLKDGEIQEIGNHKQLLKNKGFYYSLYKANAVMEDHE